MGVSLYIISLKSISEKDKVLDLIKDYNLKFENLHHIIENIYKIRQLDNSLEELKNLVKI